MASEKELIKTVHALCVSVVRHVSLACVVEVVVYKSENAPVYDNK